MTDDDEPIDWEVARRLTGGDENLLRDLIELFPSESAKHLNEIETGIADGDGERVSRGAHSLKGAAGLFGAARLVALALELEGIGKANDFEQAKSRLPGLEAETSRLAGALAERH